MKHLTRATIACLTMLALTLVAHYLLDWTLNISKNLLSKEENGQMVVRFVYSAIGFCSFALTLIFSWIVGVIKEKKND